ncbi:hypothetical protein JCM6882_005009 [Rhodosporidiobolus microsporus]
MPDSHTSTASKPRSSRRREASPSAASSSTYPFQPFPSPFPHPSSSSAALPASESLLRARTAARTPSAAHSLHSHQSRTSTRDRDGAGGAGTRSQGQGQGWDTASESGMSVLSAFAPDAARAREDRERRRAERRLRRREERHQEEERLSEGTRDEKSRSKRDDPTDSPLRRWARWTLDQPQLKPWALVLAVVGVVLVKWCVGLGGYSGFADPPMRGDLEAQRHWLALTSSSLSGRSSVPLLPFLRLYDPPSPPSSNGSLPAHAWYFHHAPYWGLDYPPLTAYHSFFLGLVARLHPESARYVTLRPVPDLNGASVGEMAAWEAEMGKLESEGGMRNWMRASVVVGDLLVWVSAVLIYCRRNYHRPSGSIRGETKAKRKMLVAVLTILLQPALLLVDNGHFQYNSLMLGLALHALNCFQSNHDLLGAVFFVLSLGFKQMALYYAPGVFGYLLGKCLWLGGRRGLTLFIHLGLTVLLTFTLLYTPLLLSSLSPLSPHSPLSVVLQSLTRIFPLWRGLFEDKVANVWCALNTFVKLRTLVSTQGLARLALAVTAVAVLPGTAGVVWVSWRLGQEKKEGQGKGKGRSSPVLSGSGAEKAPNGGTVDDDKAGVPPTAPLLPHLLLLSSLSFFLFSFQVHEKSILLPLMPLTLLMGGREVGEGRMDWEWGVLVNNVGVFSMFPLLLRDGLPSQYVALLLLWNFAIGYNPFSLRPGSFVKLLSLTTYLILTLIHLAQLLTTPPPHLPDLFPVLNLTLSCGVFGLAWLWAGKRVAQEAWAVVGLGMV